jgi:hypothetical protein
MAEQLTSLQTVDECKDGGFIGNPFTRVLHIKPSCKESSRGLIVSPPAPLEVTDIMRSLIGTLEVFGKRSLHIEPGLDGIFCKVVDPLPRCAR